MENMVEFIWSGNFLFIKIKKLRFHLCTQSYLEKASQIRIDYRTVYQIAKDPNVFKSSKYNQNVWTF